MKLTTFKNKSQAFEESQEKGAVGLTTNKIIILLSYETTGKRKGLKSFSV